MLMPQWRSPICSDLRRPAPTTARRCPKRHLRHRPTVQRQQLDVITHARGVSSLALPPSRPAPSRPTHGSPGRLNAPPDPSAEGTTPLSAVEQQHTAPHDAPRPNERQRRPPTFSPKPLDKPIGTPHAIKRQGQKAIPARPDRSPGTYLYPAGNKVSGRKTPTPLRSGRCPEGIRPL